MTKVRSPSPRRQVRKVDPKGGQKKDRRSSSTAKRHRASRQTKFRTEWQRWEDACRQIFATTKDWDMAHAELAPKLRSGKIPSLLRSIDFQTREIQEHPLPTAFWREVTITVQLGLLVDTTKWSTEKRSANALPSWWPLRSWHYFFLRRSDIDRYWPSVGARAEPRHASETTSRVSPGTKPTGNWHTLIAQWLIAVAVENPERLQNVDALVIEAQKFLHKRIKWAPSDDKALRGKIRELLREVRF